MLTEQRKRQIANRLKSIDSAVANIRKKIESNKRYFTAPSYYPLKSNERRVDDNAFMVESTLTEQDQTSMRMMIKRLLDEEASLRTELTSKRANKSVADCN